MENFFEWMSKPIPEEEVDVWFNVHNMNIEKIGLCGDFFKGLYLIIRETYLGEDDSEIKIQMSDEDTLNHFDWCWNKNLENFQKENIFFKKEGSHKDYAKSFFLDTFYKPKDKSLKKAIPTFLEDVFCLETAFSKSDLDLLTELYGLLFKNFE